ncbi:MAG TPA: hypothetical protein VGW58_15740 [Pyrinomonadaceae bacterium]|nr:hypothetical protein [Pyrinomonadaceae bacterium]
MLRVIAISLILVLSVGVMLPFENSAHGVRQSVQVHKRRYHHRHRSRAWWRRYRARLRQKREAALAFAAHRNALLTLPANIPIGDLSAVGGPAVPVLPDTSARVTTMPAPPAFAVAAAAKPQPVSVPSNAQPVFAAASNPQPVLVPSNEQPNYSGSSGQTRPRVVGNLNAAVKAPAAKMPGQMSVSVVALSRPNPVFLTSREEKGMLGGLAVADLRRIVIDKMVAAGGWVTNDFIREVNGHRVFVVTARTPGDTLTPEKAWTFYFTEAGGRIYGLTTDTPLEFSDRMSTEAERYIQTLRASAVSGSNK